MGKEKIVADAILACIGGKENIASVEHCATRLRLVLNNKDKYDKAGIENIDGVKGQFFASGQHQIVLGTGFVNKVYGEIAKGEGLKTQGLIKGQDDSKWLQKASRVLGDVFVPIIPILVATGLFMGLRSLLQNLGVEMNPTILILSQVLIDTAFAFLPALVAYSAMRKFGGSPALGIVIGLMLVAPQLPNANAVASGTADPIYLNLLGLAIPIVGYQGSVLPALLLGILASKIEGKLRNIVPDVLDLIVTPFLTLLTSMVCGLLIIGPIMHKVELLIVEAIRLIMNIPFGIGGFFVGAFQQVVVITGLHHAFKALEIELLANTGANPFNALVCGAIVAQGAAGIAAALKTKNAKKRSLHLSSTLPAFLGITEPLIFGTNLPEMKPFIFGCIGGGCAGIFSSIVGLAGTGMSITALPGILLYLDGQLFKYFIACAIGFVVAFGLTFCLYTPKEDD